MTAPKPKVITFGSIKAYGENNLEFKDFHVDGDGCEEGTEAALLLAVISRLEDELFKVRDRRRLNNFTFIGIPKDTV